MDTIKVYCPKCDKLMERTYARNYTFPPERDNEEWAQSRLYEGYACESCECIAETEIVILYNPEMWDAITDDN